MTLKASTSYRRAFVIGAIGQLDPEDFKHRAAEIRTTHKIPAGKDLPLFLSGAELAGEQVFDMLQPRVEELESLAEQSFRIANNALSLAGAESTPALLEILELRNLFVKAAGQAWEKFYATLDVNLTHTFGVDIPYFTSDKELPLAPFMVELAQMAMGGDVHPYINWLYFWLRDETPTLLQIMGRKKLPDEFFAQAREMRDPEASIREYSRWVRSVYKTIRTIVDAEAKKHSMPGTEFNMAVANLYGETYGKE